MEKITVGQFFVTVDDAVSVIGNCAIRVAVNDDGRLTTPQKDNGDAVVGFYESDNAVYFVYTTNYITARGLRAVDSVETILMDLCTGLGNTVLDGRDDHIPFDPCITDCLDDQ